MLSFNCDKDIAVLVTLINFMPEFYVVFNKDRAFIEDGPLLLPDHGEERYITAVCQGWRPAAGIKTSSEGARSRSRRRYEDISRL